MQFVPCQLLAPWFSASNHGVKIVILAKFDHRQREIILGKWEEEPEVSTDLPGTITKTTGRCASTRRHASTGHAAENRHQPRPDNGSRILPCY